MDVPLIEESHWKIQCLSGLALYFMKYGKVTLEENFKIQPAFSC
jgi:hypothetical protein